MGDFVADADFSSGGTYAPSPPPTIDTSAVTNPAPQSVYQSERFGYPGNFTYTLPNLTPGGSYLVRLHFAEIWFNGPGQRVFNVSLNGVPVLSNFDIFALVGAMNKAVIEEFTTAADTNG